MEILIRKYEKSDVSKMVKIWNQVVNDGVAFPQIEPLDAEDGEKFFKAQSYCGVAEDPDAREVIGLYILHPNNIGRCGHIANASYAVGRDARGRHVGEKLVIDSMKQGSGLGFRILQFNAVVQSNVNARHLYEKLGFHQLGLLPKGFLMKDRTYEDIVLYYHEL
ncbi:GNAT family N-acetyltransferase [Caproiciproducens sp. NJN-50]|uniref:GNAT family N-acetyltransferase n=1 Tax=Acutalibacteraceae TaxID=3082771 RepID=UPI000FFE1103|nr:MULTISPECIES: GNAT family N-acetyltransferase [Acutalibacteraceae]QAT48658.1 GNAT family N-acetyltransferase [Caproiciproducens sp. NJN-50]